MELSPRDVTVIANTGDDELFWGLLVCPDVDAVIYRLANVFDDERGYGQRDESFALLDALTHLDEPAWFRIGDRDFATHVLRTDLMRRGATLTQATHELCRRYGVESRVLPMSDGAVRTRFRTQIGNLSFQEYFVREGLRPALHAVEFDGIDDAKPTDEVVGALEQADIVVIGPSNPLISIEPILRVAGRSLRRERTIAVTPIVGGAALKGPTVEMMTALGIEPSPVEVARRYREVAAGFVLDVKDAALASDIEALGYVVTVTRTVMSDGGRSLAAALVRAVLAK